MAKRTSRLGRIGKFFRKERMEVVRDIEKQKLPRWVDVHHKKITVGEAMERLRAAESKPTSHITLGLMRPPPFYDKRKWYENFEEAVRRIAPQATIEYKPLQWMVKGKVKDPFRDVVVSNLTIGQAVQLGSFMSFSVAQWKG
jgi:hypothetical protein